MRGGIWAKQPLLPFTPCAQDSLSRRECSTFTNLPTPLLCERWGEVQSGWPLWNSKGVVAMNTSLSFESSSIMCCQDWIDLETIYQWGQRWRNLLDCAEDFMIAFYVIHLTAMMSNERYLFVMVKLACWYSQQYRTLRSSTLSFSSRDTCVNACPS